MMESPRQTGTTVEQQVLRSLLNSLDGSLKIRRGRLRMTRLKKASQSFAPQEAFENGMKIRPLPEQTRLKVLKIHISRVRNVSSLLYLTLGQNKARSIAELIAESIGCTRPATSVREVQE